MLHFMTVTETRPGLFRRGTMVTSTRKYLLNWEGVKNLLNQTRDWAKGGPNRSYNITLAAYRGQPLYRAPAPPKKLGGAFPGETRRVFSR